MILVAAVNCGTFGILPPAIFAQTKNSAPLKLDGAALDNVVARIALCSDPPVAERLPSNWALTMHGWQPTRFKRR
jgi:hypothetical protein